jgi:starch synthase
MKPLQNLSERDSLKIAFRHYRRPRNSRNSKREPIDFVELTKIAVDYSDGVIQGSQQIDRSISEYIAEKNIQFFDYEEDFDKNVERIENFYEKILS